MKATEIDTNLIDNYFVLLKNLSYDNKRGLIAWPSKSIATTDKEKDNSWESLFGALIPGQSL